MQDTIFIINIILFIVLFGGYCILIFNYQKWFSQLRQFIPQVNMKPETTFSIIIPSRNEEENIADCINSILRNNYPTNLFEIIVVDDFSEDKTAEIVQQFEHEYSNIKLIELKNTIDKKINSYKKKAIETGIGNSKFEWIIATDADCIVTHEWLHLFDKYIQANNPVFIAAPVIFKNNNSFLSIFQCLDFMSLQGITAASSFIGFHSMCNGANLAYQKKVFISVNGFKDVDNIASGDDMLLMHKIKIKYPKGIGYLFNSNAIVSTIPMLTWRDFFNQRIRWASKATSYSDKNIFWVLFLVYMLNLYICILPFMSFFSIFYLKFWVVLLVVKTFCELMFMLPVAQFFSLKKNNVVVPGYAALSYYLHCSFRLFRKIWKV